MALPDNGKGSLEASVLKLPWRANTWRSYIATAVVVGIATAVCALLYRVLGAHNLVMVYLLGIAFVSTVFGSREAVLSTLLSVCSFNFFFVEPRFTLRVADAQYLLTFAVMLVVGVLIGRLTQSLRALASAAASREQRTAALLSLSRRLAGSRSKSEIAEATRDSVQEICGVGARVLLQDSPSATADQAPSGLTVPLHATRGNIGSLVLEHDSDFLIPEDQREMLNAVADQSAVAFERAILAKESHVANLHFESERLKNSLLSSVSHDLRTPLTSIAGAASTLMKGETDGAKLRELAATIYEESDRLNRLVRNLLDMTRLESGKLHLHMDWNSIEELVGAAVARTEALFENHTLEVRVEPNLPLFLADGLLIEQVLINLLENEARHTPAGTRVTLAASQAGGFIRIEVADDGPGIPQGQEDEVFEKFYRSNSSTQGVGLGLAICRGILKAHDAQVWARNQVSGGAMFVFELPITPSPAVPDEY